MKSIAKYDRIKDTAKLIHTIMTIAILTSLMYVLFICQSYLGAIIITLSSVIEVHSYDKVLKAIRYDKILYRLKQAESEENPLL